MTGMTRRDERVVSLSAEISGEPTEIAVGKQVILLSNAHVAGFVERHLGVQLPIYRMLPQVMALEARIPPPMTHLIGHAHRTLAIKPLPDGRVMVSGGWRGRWDEATGQGEPVAAAGRGQSARGGRGLSGAGGFAGGRGLTPTARRWSLLMEFRLLIICPARRICSSVSVGRGMAGRLRRRSRRLMAEWVLGGERPEMLAPFGAWAVYLI